MAKPLMIWSAIRWMEKNAWMVARTPPAAMAPRTPITQLPVSAQTTIPKNAPASIIPSSPMFTTPERSQKMPPIAASASGVAKRSVAATRPMLKTDSSSVAASFWNQIAQAIAMSATPTAHQPSFLSPRVSAQRPSAAPRTATAAGTTRLRSVKGGIESHSARTPRQIPVIASERGSPSRRRRSWSVGSVCSTVLMLRLARFVSAL